MQAQDQNRSSILRTLFKQAPFIADIGMELVDAGAGWCETEIALQPKHLQQDGFVHAGVIATMADHTAGASAGTLANEGNAVLTIEFKINLLRPAKGEKLKCRAQVLKPGKMITVSESEVFGVAGEQTTLVAKATVTLAIVAKT